MSATMAPDSVRRSLKLLQDRQKFYHFQHTHSLSPLQRGDAVRVHNGQSWQAAKVIGAHQSPRSYQVQTDNGTHLRRNRRDLIRTREDLLVCAHHIDDDELSAPLQSNAVPSLPPCIKTRSGRSVKLPVRFRDYVMN